MRQTKDELDSMSAKAVAKMLGFSEARLATDRYKGRGIPYVKYGRSVRYMRRDVEAWIRRNRVEPTG